MADSAGPAYLDDDRLAEVVAAAPHLDVGIVTPSGPHVTPELFSVSGGVLWCLAAASTLKARTLRGDDRVAIAAAAPNGSWVAIRGHAVVVDPARPLAAPPLAMAAAAPRGLMRFASRNLAELSGAAVQLLAGRLGGPLPPRRVVIAIEPTAMLVTDGTIVVSSHGWEERPSPRRRASAVDDSEVDLEALPDEYAHAREPGPAALGWTTAEGAPLVLRGTWDPGAGTIGVIREAFDAIGAPANSPASVTRDAWSGLGPGGKTGVLLRGQGAAAYEGDLAIITLATRSVTRWDGIDTATVTAADLA